MNSPFFSSSMTSDRSDMGGGGYAGQLKLGQPDSVQQRRTLRLQHSIGNPMSLFTAVEMAPRDPILGLNEQFNADANPHKVNLGVGVYYDDNGKLPLLECVQAAEKQMMESPKARGYLPIDGIAAYDTAVKNLVFGADSEPVREGRVATVQAIGGTGGLKIGAD